MTLQSSPPIESAENTSSTSPAYVIFAGLDEAELPRWLQAAAQRFAGCNYRSVQIGGQVKHADHYYPCAASAAKTIAGTSRRDLFLVVPDSDHQEFAAFTKAGLNPKYVEAKKFGPDAWVAGAAPQAA